jgi:hypothetical protein
MPLPKKKDNWINIDDKDRPPPKNGEVVWIAAGFIHQAYLKKGRGEIFGFPVHDDFFWCDIEDGEEIPCEEVTQWKPILDSEL